MVNTSPRNMAFGKVNAYIVLAHNERQPRDDEWQEYLAFASRHFERGVRARFLVTTTGGTPTMAQQRQLIDWSVEREVGDDVARIAVVSMSTFAHGIVQALNRLGPNIRGFASDDMAGALAFLGVAPAYHKDVVALEASLRRELG